MQEPLLYIEDLSKAKVPSARAPKAPPTPTSAAPSAPSTKPEVPEAGKAGKTDCPYGGGDECKAHGGNGAKTHLNDSSVMRRHNEFMAKEGSAKAEDAGEAAAGAEEVPTPTQEEVQTPDKKLVSSGEKEGLVSSSAEKYEETDPAASSDKATPTAAPAAAADREKTKTSGGKHAARNKKRAAAKDKWFKDNPEVTDADFTEGGKKIHEWVNEMSQQAKAGDTKGAVASLESAGRLIDRIGTFPPYSDDQLGLTQKYHEAAAEVHQLAAENDVEIPDWRTTEKVAAAKKDQEAAKTEEAATKETRDAETHDAKTTQNAEMHEAKLANQEAKTKLEEIKAQLAKYKVDGKTPGAASTPKAKTPKAKTPKAKTPKAKTAAPKASTAKPKKKGAPKSKKPKAEASSAPPPRPPKKDTSTPPPKNKKVGPNMKQDKSKYDAATGEKKDKVKKTPPAGHVPKSTKSGAPGMKKPKSKGEPADGPTTTTTTPASEAAAKRAETAEKNKKPMADNEKKARELDASRKTGTSEKDPRKPKTGTPSADKTPRKPKTGTPSSEKDPRKPKTGKRAKDAETATATGSAERKKQGRGAFAEFYRKFKDGRVPGTRVGEAAAVADAGGHLLSAGVEYGIGGALAAGQHLLKDGTKDRVPQKSPKTAGKKPKSSQVEQSSMKSLSLFLDLDLAKAIQMPNAGNTTPDEKTAQVKHKASYAKRPVGVANEGIVTEDDPDVGKKWQHAEEDSVQAEVDEDLKAVDEEEEEKKVNKATEFLMSMNAELQREVRSILPNSLEVAFMVEELGYEPLEVSKGLLSIRGKDRHRFNIWSHARLSKSIVSLNRVSGLVND